MPTTITTETKPCKMRLIRYLVIFSSLGGLVKVNKTEANTGTEWYYAGYYTDFGYEANYDLYDVSGWGPDYGDPQTYLDTFLPDYAGYMVKCTGIF